MLPAKTAISEKIIKETAIKTKPSIKNWYIVDIVWLNKNPGNNARKKMDTFGFKTFIMNPCLNNCDLLFFVTSFEDSEIVLSLLNTL